MGPTYPTCRTCPLGSAVLQGQCWPCTAAKGHSAIRHCMVVQCIVSNALNISVSCVRCKNKQYGSPMWVAAQLVVQLCASECTDGFVASHRMCTPQCSIRLGREIRLPKRRTQLPPRSTEVPTPESTHSSSEIPIVTTSIVCHMLGV